MAVRVHSEFGNDEHKAGAKWVVDDDKNLIVLGKDSKAVAIYADGQWSFAEVTA